MRLFFTVTAIAAVLTFSSFATPVAAQDAAHLQLIIKDHKFAPAELHVQSGKAMFLDVVNSDPTPEEFESSILAIEKVVTGSGHIRVHLPPLTPGRYPFFGEFHQDTAQGAVVADPPPPK